MCVCVLLGFEYFVFFKCVCWKLLVVYGINDGLVILYIISLLEHCLCEIHLGTIKNKRELEYRLKSTYRLWIHSTKSNKCEKKTSLWWVHLLSASTFSICLCIYIYIYVFVLSCFLSPQILQSHLVIWLQYSYSYTHIHTYTNTENGQKICIWWGERETEIHQHIEHKWLNE